MIYQALLWRSLFFVRTRSLRQSGRLWWKMGQQYSSTDFTLYSESQQYLYSSRWTKKKYIEDITWPPRGDTSVEKYFTSERSEWVKYFFQREKTNFVSPSDHVMFYLLYKHQWNAKPFYLNSFLVWKVRFIMKP